ncbi:MAG: hypothetical protein HDS83_00010 [Bacteroidales bacterium]|nr:hypothetical protein [Bacteroidales bacterium]
MNKVIIVDASEELHCDNLLVITNSQEEIIKWKGKKITILKVSTFM